MAVLLAKMATITVPQTVNNTLPTAYVIVYPSVTRLLLATSWTAPNAAVEVSAPARAPLRITLLSRSTYFPNSAAASSDTSGMRTPPATSGKPTDLIPAMKPGPA